MPRLLPDAHGLPRSFWFLLAGTLINRLGGFVAPFLALYLSNARGMPVEQVGLIVALVGAGSIGSGPLGGFIADRFGRRLALGTATALGGSAMLALGFAATPLAIGVAAFALGLFGDLYRPAVAAIVADIVPTQDRPRAYGLLHWVVNVGFAASTIVAGLVAERGFTWLFVGDAATTFAFGIVLWLNVPETRPAAAPGHAARGAYGRPYRDGRFLGFVAVSLLLATIFLQGNTTLPVDMRAHGVSPRMFGALLAINGVMIVLVGPFASSIVRRFAPAHVLAAAAVLTGAGFGMTGLARGSIGVYALSIAVWTLGEIATAPVTPSVIAELAPPELRGSYQGAYQITWGAGSFLSPAVGALVMGRFGAGTLWWSCVGAGVVAAVGFLRVLRLTRTSRPA